MKSFVSKEEIEELSEALISDYMNLNNCSRVDIDGFITDYLNLDIVYVAFAEEDMTKEGYLSDGISPLLVHEDGKIRKIVFPKYTIVLDRYLLRDEQSGRRRFTLAHEIGHYLFCIHNPEQTIPSYRRTFDNERDYTKEELSEMFSFGEFLADKMGACLLMPRVLIERELNKYYKKKRISVYGNSIIASEDKTKLRKMADVLGVSYSALVIRLKNLCCFDYHEITEYIDKVLKVGDVL